MLLVFLVLKRLASDQVTHTRLQDGGRDEVGDDSVGDCLDVSA